jgi:hypothetical protein
MALNSRVCVSVSVLPLERVFALGARYPVPLATLCLDDASYGA